MRVTRRSFNAALLCAVAAPWASNRPQDSRPGSPTFEISLAQWSLHRALRKGDLSCLEFPQFAKTTFGIKAVEYVNSFFPPKSESAWFHELKKRAEGAGVKSLLIMCDGLGHLGDADEKARRAAVEAHRPMLDAASLLGCHSIRVNAHSTGTFDEQRDLAADGLSRLADFAAKLSLNVLVENHGGLSSNGSWLAAVMKKVAHPRCGTLPDFGNFKIDDEVTYDRYKGVEELMPFAKAVSAKSYDFDDRGSETTIDYPRMLGIVRSAGYHGHVGIEYEGGRLSEIDGIKATLRLLERVRDTTGR